jgi:acetyltransferase-like isoleucine patch superfamily enzyme
VSFDVREVTGEWDRRRIPAGVQVGERCWIERPQSFERFRSRREPGLVLGDDVRVYCWSTFSVHADGVVTIGRGSILVGAMFMCQERINVGEEVVISYGVTIADSDFHPRDPEARRRDAEASAPGGSEADRPLVDSAPIEIDDRAWIGIGAIILKGVRIGRGARVGAGAVVSRDVAPGGRVEGNPARTVEA